MGFEPATPVFERAKTCNRTYAREMLGNLSYFLFAELLPRCQCASGRSCDRPSRHRFSWFSSISKQMLRWFQSSQVTAACFSCSHPGFIFIRIKLPCRQSHKNLIFQIIRRHYFRKSKSRAPCLKPLLATILTSTLPHCPYENDEREKPGTF
jgi:hypothetical protein